MDDFDDTFQRDTAQGGRQPWRNKSTFFFMLGMGAFLLSCLVLLVAVFMYFNTDKAPVRSIATNTAGTLLAIGKLMDLPSDESPQIAPINDIAVFQNQPFFSRARTGDILIVYIQNHIAILYDPEWNKIINMSKISVVIPKTPALP